VKTIYAKGFGLTKYKLLFEDFQQYQMAIFQQNSYLKRNVAFSRSEYNKGASIVEFEYSHQGQVYMIVKFGMENSEELVRLETDILPL